MVKIQECMSRGAEVISPEAFVRDAAAKMRTQDLGMLPVVEDNRIVGSVTDRDIALNAFRDASDPSTLRVRDVMSAGIRWCFEDQTLDEAVRIMTEAKVRRLPVVDRDKRLIGTLGVMDIVTSDEPQRAIDILRGVFH